MLNPKEIEEIREEFGERFPNFNGGNNAIHKLVADFFITLINKREARLVEGIMAEIDFINKPKPIECIHELVDYYPTGASGAWGATALPPNKQCRKCLALFYQ